MREQVELAVRVVHAFFAKSGASEADIDDCIGDVLETLARRPIGEVDERGPVPVLIQRVRWSIIDSLRRRRRAERSAQRIADEFDPQLFPSSDEERLEVEVRQVLSALRSMEPADVDLVVSTTAFDESLESVAARTGLSVSGAWRRRERALGRLRARSGGSGQPLSMKKSRGSGARRDE